MASSSSSSTPNKLQNSYFFYGTHPLKVPNTLVHANSTTRLSTDPNSTHLSLDLANSNHYHHGFSSTTDLTTTKSLHSFGKSRTDDADENNEVNIKKKKRDVYESFILITYVCHCPDNVIVRININI